MRSKASRLISLILICAVLLCSCNSKADQSGIAGQCSQYIGDTDYSSTISALVYEQIPGEEDGGSGIVYKVVTDPEGLLSQNTVPVCLYFYSSMDAGEMTGITAGVEDLAQMLSDQVLFVALDGITQSQISSRYAVEAYPEFVLIAPGKEPVKFEGMRYDEWTIYDVTAWLSANGYTADMSKLEG